MDTTTYESLLAALRPHAKYKESGHILSRDIHLPLLQNTSNNSEPKVVHLGTSIIQNLSEPGIGHSPSFDPWPPATLLPELPENGERLSGVLNLGCKGDTLPILIYRLLGSESTEQPLQGLLSALRGKEVKLWVINAGTIDPCQTTRSTEKSSAPVSSRR
jgi:hypothetical protein